MEQKMRERERALKAKDYARKQREIINQKNVAKKAAVTEPHVQAFTKKERIAVEVIQEVPEEQNESTPFAENKKAEVIVEHNDKVEAKVQLIEQFQHID